MPSTGETTAAGTTPALPPPCTRASTAFGPSTATRVSAAGSRGSREPLLRNSTEPAATARRSRPRDSSGVIRGGGTDVVGSSAPTRRASSRIRRTFSSTADSGTSPRRTAASSGSPRSSCGPGMARSTGDSTVRTAPQSETTRPSKPHVPRSGSASSGLSDIDAPFTPL